MKQLVLGMILLMSAPIFAQSRASATGGGNGGQTIYRGSNAYLRDLIENNNCIWKNYNQIQKEAPKLSKVLNQMYKLNSSFTLRLEEEMTSLGYCFTPKRLPYLQYNNSDDIHIFANQEYDQAAINDHGIVFIDTNIFNKMDRDNKAYLFMHEAAHELFNKSESREKREPRLREFLMNIFKQIDHLEEQDNKDGFNYIIQKANFSALEDVIALSEEGFKIVFMNDESVTLARKVKALKEIDYKKPLKIYSKTLKENALKIEQKRVAQINSLLKYVNYRTNKENFSQLVENYGQLSEYIYNDSNRVSSLKQALKYMLQTYDLRDHNSELKTAIDLIKVETTRVYYSGKIAINYDSVFGIGTFATKLLLNEKYLKIAIFGKKYMVAEDSWKSIFCSYHCTQHYFYRFNGYSTLSGKELGLLYDAELKGELSKYLSNEASVNRVLATAIKEITETDLLLIRKEGFSNYILPENTKKSKAIYKKTLGGWIKSKSARKFKGDEKKKEVELREKLIKSLD